MPRTNGTSHGLERIYMPLVSSHRVTAAILLAPVLALSIFGMGVCSIDGLMSESLAFPGGSHCVVEAVPIAVVIGSIFALPIAVVVGFPAFNYCARRGWLSWWQMSTAGVVCTLRAPLLLDAFAPSKGEVLWLFYLCMPIGLVAGFLFWLIGVYRNASCAPPAAMNRDG